MPDTDSVSPEKIQAELTAIVPSLQSEGLDPVLIGGLALAVLGSTRVTRDADFMLADSEPVRRSAVRAMFAAGFELISRWDKENYRPLRTIDNAVVAAVRVVMDDPDSAFFWKRDANLRVDLIFRLSISAEDLVSRARRIPLPGGVKLLLASPEDLARLKRASLRDNPKRVSDMQDLIFLRSIIKPPPKKRGRRKARYTP